MYETQVRVDGQWSWMHTGAGRHEVALTDAEPSEDALVELARCVGCSRDDVRSGDDVTVALCRVALEQPWETGDEERDSAARRGMERVGVIPEHVDADVRALAECRRVILATRALGAAS